METSLPDPTATRRTPPYAAPREVEHPLAPLRSVETQVLVWIQPRLMHPAYELWAGEQVVATLRFNDLATRSGLAASSDDLWTIDDAGRADGSLVVQSGSTAHAVFHPENESRGVLIVRDERPFVWEQCDLWQREWTFFDEQKKPLMRFEPELQGQGQTRVRVEDELLQNPDSPLLAVMGKYLSLALRTPS